MAHHVDQKSNELMLELQDDFNRGDPFDLSIYAEKLAVLVGVMGFDKLSALEALVVLSNAGQTIDALDPEAAVQYILSNEEHKRNSRAQAKLNVGKSLMTFEESIDLIRLIQAQRQKLRKEWLQRMRLEMMRYDDAEAMRKLDYENFLRGITANRLLTAKEVEALEEYKKANGVTDVEHAAAVKSIGLTEAALEKMKQSGSPENAGTAKKVRDCHHCFDNQKMYISMSCMHVSLCEDCAGEHNTKKSRIACPVCKMHTDRFERVYI